MSKQPVAFLLASAADLSVDRATLCSLSTLNVLYAVRITSANCSTTLAQAERKAVAHQLQARRTELKLSVPL